MRRSSDDHEIKSLISRTAASLDESHYIVHHERPFTMNIRQHCPELNALMAEHNAVSAAFITAWNPFSQSLSAKENKARQDELKATRKHRGLTFIE